MENGARTSFPIKSLKKKTKLFYRCKNRGLDFYLEIQAFLILSLKKNRRFTDLLNNPSL